MGLSEGVIVQEIHTVLPVFEHAQVDMDLYSNTVDVIPVADLFSHFGYCPSSQLCENCFHRTWYVHCQFIFTTFAMERSNETRALQGGGSGGGLEVPFAILRTEHENRPTIMRRLCAPGSSEGLMCVWNESLMNRCFVLNARAQLNTFGQHRVDRHETNEPFHLKTKQNNPARPIFSNTGTGIANSVFKSQKTQVKLVPGVPKNVEDAIRLWLEGDHFSIYPVNKFCFAEFRRSVIPNYKNSIWVSSGQKKALQMFKEVIEVLSSFLEGSNRLKLFTVTDKVLWTEAVRRFHEKYDIEGKLPSLRKAVQEWKKENVPSRG